MDIYKSMYEIMTRTTAVTSSRTYPGYNTSAMRNQGSRDDSVSSGNKMALTVGRISGQRWRQNVMLAVVMLAVLSAVIVVPIVNQNESYKGTNDDQVVSVMTIKEQRRLILRAKQNCYKLRERQWSVVNNTSGPMCNATWDGMLCWDPTPAGITAQKPCPDYINGFNKNEMATKTCNENGSWWVNPDLNAQWTNYSDCVKPSIDVSFHSAQGFKLKLLYTIGYSFSIGALLVAIVIMLCCKHLHSKSNTLHINLFLTFILRAVISFLKDNLFVSHLGFEKDVYIGADGSVEFIEGGDHWECKLLTSIFMYSVNACNMWIFAEAVYLTMLVYKPLTTERTGVKVYIVLGWSLSFVFIIPWIIVKALYEDRFCWNFQHNPDYYWILRGSGVGVVVINFCLFLNIFRKLFLKIRQSSNLGISGKSKYRRLAKFILVLIPLFGIMYIVFYVAVPSNFEETDYNLAYLYLEMGYNSFQGFLLALLFCFLNEEVHLELKRAWLRHRNRRTGMSIINRSFNHFHSSHRKTMSCNSREDDSRTGHCIPSNRKSKELYRLRTFSVSSDNNELTRVTTSFRSFPHPATNVYEDNFTTGCCDLNPKFPQSTYNDSESPLTNKQASTKGLIIAERALDKALNVHNSLRNHPCNHDSFKTYLLTPEEKEDKEKDFKSKNNIIKTSSPWK